MKLISLILGFCLITACVFADVIAEVIAKDIDTNSNIIIRTQYKIDGQEVISRYPKDAQGRYYWQTRYNIINFVGMNETQIADRIKQDLSQFAQHLITQKYITEENAKLDLKNIIGQKITETTATIQVSPTLEYIVRTDGSKIEKIITPSNITQ